MPLKFYFSIYIFLCTIYFTSFNCNAQSNIVQRRNNFGFSFFVLNKKYNVKELDLLSNNNIGFGAGIFYLINLNKSFNINVEAKSSLEYSKLMLDKKENVLRHNNISLPIELQYHLKGTKVFIFSGIEYSYNKQREIASFETNKNLFGATAGLKYQLDFEIFKIIPEIRYSYGLNNSLKNIDGLTNLGDLYARKSGFEFTIKFM